MPQEYYTLLTAVGKARLATVVATGTPMAITKFAVGTGDLAGLADQESITALIDEKYRGLVVDVFADPVETTQIVVDCIVPEAEGGWNIQEVGLFNAADELVAIAKVPLAYKPAGGSGALTDFRLNIVMSVENADNVILSVDPLIVTASRGFVNAALLAHDSDVSAHAAMLAAFSAGLVTVPVGTLAYFPFISPPSGWLVRDGANLSRTTYADLYAKIGDLGGAGDGSTSFDLPDDRGLIERGWDNGAGIDVGRALGSYQADDNKSHTHTYTRYSGGWVQGQNDGNPNVWVSTSGQQTGSSGGVEARPKNRAYLPCIKY